MKDLIFPCWLYKKDEAKLFKSEQELNEAGKGWVDSPASLSGEEIIEDLKLSDEKPKSKKGK